MGNKNDSLLPPKFLECVHKLGCGFVTTTVHDNYLMFLRVGHTMEEPPTDRDAVARAELIIRRQQWESVELLKKHVPGCEKAFITRTSPSLNIRRARVIECDYDVTLSDVLDARHFDDDVMTYGFHDNSPRLQIRDGGTYGIPYRAIRAKGIDNLLVAGMMITSNHDAHMSTRNTVSCMAQGQAAGTAAGLCATQDCGTRELDYSDLRGALKAGGVYFEGDA
jgi:hypothetical protein